MFRGRWGIFVAVVGVALLVGLLSVSYSLYNSGEQQHSGYRYQPAGKPSLGLNAITKTPSNPYQPNCQNPDNHEDADLCAQWAAADQVAESNRLASVNTRLTTLTLLLTVFGTLLLVWTFDETRETSRRELRAYVLVEGKGIYFNAETGTIAVDISVVNTGNTPAIKVCWGGNVAITTSEQLERVLLDPDDTQRPDAPPVCTTIGADRDAVASLEGSEKFTHKDFNDALGESPASLFVYGTVWYLDAFKNERFTNFCQVAEKRTGLAGIRPTKEGEFPFLTTPFHNDSD